MECRNLEEIATNFRYGKMPDKEKITENGKYPIWSGYRYVGYYDEKNVVKNEVVVVARGVGGTGDVKICKEDCFLTNLSIAFTVNEDINPLYVYYFYQIKNLRYLDSGSAQSQITINDLKNVKIPTPNKSIQDKIVEVLNKIDQKIELNNKINNNLHELCNNIFHDYLDRYENKVEYKKIVDIAKKVVTGKTPSTANKEFWDGDIPFITIPDMHNQVFTIKTERSITELGAKSTIPKNSISVSCIATVGLVSINTVDSQTNQQINSIVINNDYDLYFLFEYLSEQEEFMKSIAGGSTTYNINKNTFENIEVPYLPKEEMIEFNNNVSNMFEKIKLNQYENEKLSKLRDTLLPKLMNGEIDLDNIEI